MSENLSWRALDRFREKGGPTEYVVGALIALVIGFVVNKTLFDLVPFLLYDLNVFLHVWWLTLIGTSAVLLVGVGLYRFKKSNQRLYGLAEIGFASAVAWASMTRAQSTTDAASWLAVLTSAYLIVRGLTNYEEGRNKINQTK